MTKYNKEQPTKKFRKLFVFLDRLDENFYRTHESVHDVSAHCRDI